MNEIVGLPFDEDDFKDKYKGRYFGAQLIDGATATVSVYKIKNGSKFSIGRYRATTFYVDHHFNWFQKLMWKWCFGIKIEDYSEE